MFYVVVALVILLAILVVFKIREFAETRARRQVASPYGMIRAPSNAALRRTRNEHPPLVSGDVPSWDSPGMETVFIRKEVANDDDSKE